MCVTMNIQVCIYIYIYVKGEKDKTCFCVFLTTSAVPFRNGVIAWPALLLCAVLVQCPSGMGPFGIDRQTETPSIYS